MAEYIDRKALGIGKCNPDIFEDKGYANGWNSAIKIIEEAPTVDVEPVKHGKWKEITTHNSCTYDYDCVCSECKISGHPLYNYCQNCGARMDGEIND